MSLAGVWFHTRDMGSVLPATLFETVSRSPTGWD
jgi:hypothetical protein